MKFNKIIFISLLFFFMSINTNAEEAKKDCSQIKNYFKKLACKTDNATSNFTSKKSLYDFLPEGVLNKKKNNDF